VSRQTAPIAARPASTTLSLSLAARVTSCSSVTSAEARSADRSRTLDPLTVVPPSPSGDAGGVLPDPSAPVRVN
jgi:hypothetical protein